ncbi:MAG: hemerythrin domain-containing protein [bacterium]|nr:hemerythrin domain-containing protein [bacterium]
MLRDASLIPLSHQHHNGLALCVLTERDLCADASPEAVAKQAKRIVERFEIELVNHFAVEEEILFPACPSPLVDELTGEHRRMESLAAQLRDNPTLDLVRQFIEILRGHIRREENELFQQIQNNLPRSTLDDLGKQIDARVIRVCL